jgi:hypothetical protein
MEEKEKRNTMQRIIKGIYNIQETRDNIQETIYKKQETKDKYKKALYLSLGKHIGKTYVF